MSYGDFWAIHCTKGNNQNLLATTIAVTASTFYLLESDIVCDGPSCVFKINGCTVHTESMHVANGTSSLIHSVISKNKTAGTTARNLWIYAFYEKGNLTTPVL